MRSAERQAFDLDDLVDSLREIDEIVGIVLFGSVARGDFDERSDYDLLIVFKDKKSMWKRWDELFKIVGDAKANIHAIPKGLDEFKSSNPVFLEQVYSQGRVLYSKSPFQVSLRPLAARPYVIVIYDMSKLSYRDKVRLRYRLYEGGVLSRAGGTKLAESCLMIPEETSGKVFAALKEHGARVKTVRVLA